MSTEEKVKYEIEQAERNLEYFEKNKNIHKENNEFIKAFEFDTIIKNEKSFIARLNRIIQK